VPEWACLLCGSSQKTLAVCGPDYEYTCATGPFTLVRCDECGHISLDPIPKAQDVAALYPPTYYTVNPDSPLYLRGFIYEMKIRRDVERIASYTDLKKVHSIVDVGCGDAARLFQFRKLLPDVECIGLDFKFQREAEERAQRERISLIVGSEDDLSGLRHGAHDFMIMSQSIEHLRNPISVLEKLRTKLAPEGFLLIETPHCGGLDYALFRNRYWGGYHLPRHFHLFTKDSLAKTVQRVGFRIVRQGSLPSPGFWIMSLRNRLGLNSRARGRSVFEFLNFSNLLTVGGFTALDLAWMALGMPTSNQFVLLQIDEGGFRGTRTPRG
jgi:ubiquinone/menaquinone biosynthesis C-methylase UbiE